MSLLPATIKIQFLGHEVAPTVTYVTYSYGANSWVMNVPVHVQLPEGRYLVFTGSNALVPRTISVLEPLALTLRSPTTPMTHNTSVYRVYIYTSLMPNLEAAFPPLYSDDTAKRESGVLLSSPPSMAFIVEIQSLEIFVERVRALCANAYAVYEDVFYMDPPQLQHLRYQAFLEQELLKRQILYLIRRQPTLPRKLSEVSNLTREDFDDETVYHFYVEAVQACQ